MSKDSRKSQAPEKEVETTSLVIEKKFSKEVINFTVENRLLEVFRDEKGLQDLKAVYSLEAEVIDSVSKIDDCELVRITIKEGRSRVNYKFEISAFCRSAFTGMLADYKNDLKACYEQMNEKPEKENKKICTSSPVCA